MRPTGATTEQAPTGAAPVVQVEIVRERLAGGLHSVRLFLILQHDKGRQVGVARETFREAKNAELFETRLRRMFFEMGIR